MVTFNYFNVNHSYFFYIKCQIRLVYDFGKFIMFPFVIEFFLLLLSILLIGLLLFLLKFITVIAIINVKVYNLAYFVLVVLKVFLKLSCVTNKKAKLFIFLNSFFIFYQ